MENFTKSYLDNSQKQELIKKNIWNEACPVGINRLNILNISYYDFEGKFHNDGKMIVLDVVADYVLEIFKELYKYKFPIQKINLINIYDGDDELSMENNNTVAFNCRKISNSDKISIHAYGLAIDVNPELNPFLVTSFEEGKNSIPVSPPKGMLYVNRTNIRAGMVETILNENNETVIDIFAKNGFSIWGGKWNDPIDLHHFQVTREQAEALASLSYEEGIEYFSKLITKTN